MRNLAGADVWIGDEDIVNRGLDDVAEIGNVEEFASDAGIEVGGFEGGFHPGVKDEAVLRVEIEDGAFGFAVMGETAADSGGDIQETKEGVRKDYLVIGIRAHCGVVCAGDNTGFVPEVGEGAFGLVKERGDAELLAQAGEFDV